MDVNTVMIHHLKAWELIAMPPNGWNRFSSPFRGCDAVGMSELILDPNAVMLGSFSVKNTAQFHRTLNRPMETRVVDLQTKPCRDDLGEPHDFE